MLNCQSCRSRDQKCVKMADFVNFGENRINSFKNLFLQTHQAECYHIWVTTLGQVLWSYFFFFLYSTRDFFRSTLDFFRSTLDFFHSMWDFSRWIPRWAEPDQNFFNNNKLINSVFYPLSLILMQFTNGRPFHYEWWPSSVIAEGPSTEGLMQQWGLRGLKIQTGSSGSKCY